MAHLAVLYAAEQPVAAPPAAAVEGPVPVGPPVLASRADNERVARDAAQTLTALGHRTEVVAAWDRVPVEALRHVDGVLNLCEGLAGSPRGESDAARQLEGAGIPFSGNGSETLRVCQRKETCRQRLQEAGVPVPAGVVLHHVPTAWPPGLPAPCIVKPAWEDASEGIDHRAVVSDLEGLRGAVARVVTKMGEPALCEQFVDGREVTASLLGAPPSVLPLGEIDFQRVRPGRPRIVCYAAKWCPDSDEYLSTPSVACRLDAATAARVKRMARLAAAALDLRDIARLDLRLDQDRRVYVIDVNPNCDLGADAGFARAAYRAGLTYGQLLEQVLDRALRQGRSRARHVTG